MYLLLYAFWLILFGQVTLEICLLGLAVVAAVALLSYRLVGYSPRQELRLLRRVPLFLAYLGVLIWEILKANCAVIGMLLRGKRAIDPVLDEADPIEDAYHLEVSSCGVERELKTDAHINACIGWRVEVRLYAAWDGAKSWVGELRGLDETGAVLVACDPDGTVRAFPKEKIASVRTVYDFGADGE